MDILTINKAPLSADNLIKVAFCLEGRDKLTKLLQYGSRALAWMFITSGPNSEIGKRFQNLMKAAQQSRKAFRLGKGLREYHKAVQVRNDTKMNQTEQMLTIIKHLGMMGYLTYDNMIFFSKAKVIDFDADTASRRGGAMWFVANAAGVYLALAALCEGIAKENALRKHATSTKDSEQVLKAEAQISRIRKGRLKQILNTIKCFCDLVVSSNAKSVRIAERISGKPLNDGVVGVTGVISALIVLFTTWPDAPKKDD